MFTGLVQTTGALSRRVARGAGFRIVIQAEMPPLELGESIAVNGACLTVAALSSDGFEADLSGETVTRTALGRLPVGGRVNLERALRAGDRLGGHFVCGHVDGIAVVEQAASAGADTKVTLRAPSELGRFLAPKGSVTLDGVSLTINASRGAVFDIMLIPHTLKMTTLDGVAPGAELNLEIDLFARYAVHWLESTNPSSASERDASLERALAEGGFLR
jgi:riboflavin synthase